MKILVLTLCTENLEYGPYTNENALSYCKKNDYDIVIHKEIIDDSRPPAWSKVLLAQQYMNKGYDYLIIKDADTLFYNFNKKLEDYVSGEDFVFCSNTYGIIDTSFFYIKCHKKNELILKRVYNEFTNHIFKRAWEQAPFHILWR
ncbi:MAG: hypothetical protein MI922_25550, partial [Bacteroidales bacterium]|nr:hypothetical protein [Bacteroidales bacterium]